MFSAFRYHFKIDVSLLLMGAVLMTTAWPLQAQPPGAVNKASKTAPTATSNKTRYSRNVQCRPAYVDIKQAKADPNSKQFNATSDVYKGTGDDVSDFVGDVQLQQGDLQIKSHYAQVKRSTQEVSARTGVTVDSNNYHITTDKLVYNYQTRRGSTGKSTYALKDGAGNVNGTTEAIILENAKQMRLKNASYTTCPPNTRGAWSINASSVDIDQNKKQGIARHARLNLFGLPVMYLPLLQFPTTDDRMTGFLTPRLKVSSISGAEFGVPLYWNIAPNLDATTMFSYMSKRGTKFDGQLRYKSLNDDGVIEYQAVMNDKLTNKDLRDYLRISHTSKLAFNTTMRIEASTVSDADYLDDMEESLHLSSIPALKRVISTSTLHRGWRIRTRFEDNQVLEDVSTEPYSKLPQITAKKVYQLDQFDVGLYSDYTYFDRESGTTGSRFYQQVKLRKTISKQAFHLAAEANLHHRQYNLKDHPEGNQYSSTIPSISLHAQLNFERRFGHKEKYIQSLVPQMKFSWVAYEDQSKLPDFDVSEQSLTGLAQVFSEKRFNGLDRIGDTQHVSFGLSSDIFDRDSSLNLFGVELAQRFYLKDRKVALRDLSSNDSTTQLDDKRSKLVLSLKTQTSDNTFAIAHVQMDKDYQQIESEQLILRHQTDGGMKLKADYSRKRQGTEQLNTAISIPLTQQWKGIAANSYDIRNERHLEKVVGLEFGNCCSRTRLLGRQSLNDDNITYDDSIMIELQLDGIGSLGSNSDTLESLLN